MAQQGFTRQLMPQRGLWTAATSDIIGPEYTPWCQNVRFRFGKVMRAPGRSITLATTLYPIMDFALNTDAKGVKTLWSLNSNNELAQFQPYQFVNMVPLNINPRSALRYSWTQGEERLFVVRASEVAAISMTTADPPVLQIENFAGSASRGSPAGVFLEYFKNHLFMMNVVDDIWSPIAQGPMSNRIQWTQAGNYKQWAVGQDGQGNWLGGFLDLYDGVVEPITGGKILNDRLVVYRNSSIVDMAATGDASNPFLPEMRVNGIGCMIPWSLVSLGQAHIFVANDYNIYSWDGVNLNPIGSPIHAYLRTLFDPYMATQGWQHIPFGAAFMGFKEYWLAIPQLGSTSWVVLIFDYFRNSWTRDTFNSLSALAEHVLPGLTGTSGFDGTGYPTNYPQMMAASYAPPPGGDFFFIDDRITGDWHLRPDDGGMDMFVDSPDMYYDKNANQNATLERVMVSEDFPRQDGDPPFQLQVSVDRGNSFGYQQTIQPIDEHWGFEFGDFNISSNVRRYRFFYPKENGAAAPTLRAYTDVYIPSGEFFPIKRPRSPRDPFFPPSGIDER